MNGLEDRLRRGLDAPLDVESTDVLLARVAAGARRRRQRRTAAIAVGAAATLTAIALGGVLLGGPKSSPEPQPAPPSPTLPAGATVGTIDVAVPDADQVFKLTVNEGCVGCSTVWLRGDDGSWERLHDFGRSAYQGGPYDPSFGPVEYLRFAANGRDGWAWGRNLHSTHDGGRTWAQIEYGPGERTDYGHWVWLTRDRAWSLHRSDRFGTRLFWTPIGDDDWSTAHVDGLEEVHSIVSTDDRVVLQGAGEGLAAPYLLSSTDGTTWTRLDLPCGGENQAYEGRSAVFVLCPSDAGATIWRSSDLVRWQRFGESDLRAVTAVLALSDDLILLVGKPTDLLVTPSGSQPVDVGLRPGEEIFQGTFGTADDTTYTVTSEHRILVSTDAGENWSELD